MNATPTSIDEFVRTLSDCGLMTAEEIHAFLRSLAVDNRPTTAQQLAKEMVARGKLTTFQAQAIQQRKTLGLVMGNYVVLDRIGRGGMGHVFKAKHKQMDRVVALKILSDAAMKSPGAVKRFKQEAKAAAKLSHPNIVAAYDAGESLGQHFLVTEYVEGETLSAVVRKQGLLSVGHAVNYIVQAARGLDYAHANGVIHRDIKPANLLLDTQGTVKILDMGIARVDEFVGKVAYASSDELQNTGVIVGTPDYMAPEQSQDLRVADARSDIYSLGCTFYFVLTGKVMYSGETANHKIAAHRENSIPFLREARGDVPECVENVFQKMVAKRPQDRQRSMSEVIAELEKCVGKQPQASRGSAPSHPYSLEETARTGTGQTTAGGLQPQSISGVGSLLDEWSESDSEGIGNAPAAMSPMAALSWRRTRRRLIKIAVAGGGGDRLPIRDPVPVASPPGCPAGSSWRSRGHDCAAAARDYRRTHAWRRREAAHQ